MHVALGRINKDAPSLINHHLYNHHFWRQEVQDHLLERFGTRAPSGFQYVSPGGLDIFGGELGGAPDIEVERKEGGRYHGV